MFAALHVVIGEKAGVLLSCATCLGSVVKVIVLEPIAVWCFRAPATVLQGASSNSVLQGASYSVILQVACMTRGACGMFCSSPFFLSLDYGNDRQPATSSWLFLYAVLKF